MTERARRTPKSILADLERVLDTLRELRGILMALLAYEHPVIGPIAAAYRLEATIAASRWHELRSAFGPSAVRRALRNARATSLEALERAVVIIAREAVEARHKADRAIRFRKKNPAVVRALRAVADKMERVAREAARGLVGIARGRGADAEWIIREYRLEEWL